MCGEVRLGMMPRLLQTLQPAVAMNPDLKDAKIINVDLADMSAWDSPVDPVLGLHFLLKSSSSGVVPYRNG